jgi:hypothetical protein
MSASTRTRRGCFWNVVVCLAVLLLWCTPLLQAQTLTQVQYRLLGLGLEVSPPALTVPRGLATQVNTSVIGAAALPRSAVVRATLRGPSFPGTISITATPGQPLPLPALSQAGTHFLEDIRLEVDTAVTLPAQPSLVNINVLEELLVSEVTSRPLSLQEIGDRGIQFDENSFKAFEFTVAFTTASEEVRLTLPVLSPVREHLPPISPDVVFIPKLEGQLFVQPFKLITLEGEFTAEIPPINGIIVIPGNIAFLNQFFSVFLMVTNEAPDGTPLVVRDLRAEITLPAGADGVLGDLRRDPPYRPGEAEFDNPLRIARTAAGREHLKAVLAPGADGRPGTADDVDRLLPQGSGTTEFLVEGVRQGSHVVDITIRGVLEGLPSGPAEVVGFVSGAVVVRDPNFALTFIHPDVVRAGELYDLQVQIHNTSQVHANLVTVSLDPRNLSGARLLHAADARQVVETIGAGDSATVTFTLEALRTGQVTASTLDLEGAEGIVSGQRLSLRAGVSEQGVPLSPDTLILPPSASVLRQRANDADLTFRAVALLGQAHSIATAPRGSLPAGIRPIPSALVAQRAMELSTAGFRLDLSYRAGPNGQAEALPEALLLTLEDLYFDFLGARTFDHGWDVLYRDSRQARLFGTALAEVIRREAETLGLADLLTLQHHWADTASYRGGHLTIMTQARSGEVPVVLTLTDRLGRRLGGVLAAQGGQRDIPGADLLHFAEAGLALGQFAMLTRPDTAPYTATLLAQQTGTFDLGMVAPGSDGVLRQVVFRDLAVTAGEQLLATIRPGATPLVVLERAGVALAPSAEEVIPDRPPEVLGVVQQADRPVDAFGRVVAVLFSEDVDKASAQALTSYAVSTATIPMLPPPALEDGNAVRQVLLQFGNRIVFVGLRDPVGPFVPRTLDISGVRDLKGQTMLPVLARPILPDPDLGSGGQLTGRVLRADGTPVPGAEITYLQDKRLFGFCIEHIITVKSADAHGGYGLDFVLQDAPDCDGEPFRIRARDPHSGESGLLLSRIRADGERQTLDVVLVGRGRVQGVVRALDGTPLANVTVRVVSATDQSEYSTRTDQKGFYRLDGVTVGPIGVEAIMPEGNVRGSARASGVVQGSTTTTVDSVIFALHQAVVTGAVRLPDGAPAQSMAVYLATAQGEFLDRTSTDAAGAFRFERVPPGDTLVRALNQAAGLVGEARFVVTDQDGPERPRFVQVLLGGTGSVAGTVFKRLGTTTLPVPGALVVGSTQRVTADANGHYVLPAVPVGVRDIQALDPSTGEAGRRSITILSAGQASMGFDIILEPLGVITGRVVDPDGQPLASQRVLLVLSGGKVGDNSAFFSVRETRTAADGTYTFDMLWFQEYPLSAVRGRDVANGTARLTLLQPHAVVDLPMVRPTGRVSGRVVDETGLAVAAEVVLKARGPNAAGLLEHREVATTISDPVQGFRFQNVFPGPFTVTAVSFFTPGGEKATASGLLPAGNPVAEDLVLVLAKNIARLHGCVLTPEGTVIAPIVDTDGVPQQLSVFITAPRLRDELKRDTHNPEPEGIRVDASTGCYVSSIPLPPDLYTVQVTDNRPGSPTFGLTGQETRIEVQLGKNTTQDVRLLGLGDLAVEVVDAQGQALPGITATVRRTTYPNEMREARRTDVAALLFTDLTEGPVSVSAVVATDPTVDVGGRDELRGFGGQASGVVLRDGLSVVRVVIAAAGTVSGRFLRPDGRTPVPNAQIELAASNRPRAFDVTDANGAFRFVGVPVGPFQLAGFDPATGRRSSAEGRVQQDGQQVVSDFLLGPLGTVRGVVLNAGRSMPIPGAEVSLILHSAPSQPRRATVGTDGTFAFASVPGGALSLLAVAPNGLSGRAAGNITSEGQVLELQVALEGSGRVEGLVQNATGVPVAAADVTLIDASGKRRQTQSGSEGDETGRFVLPIVPLGAFTLEARPPGAVTPGDGARFQGTVTTDGQVVPVDLTFQGTITVGVKVTGTVGPAPVEVTLTSTGLFGGRAAPTTMEGDVLLFEGVPRAPLTVAAKQVTPVGTVISAHLALGDSDLPGPGGRLVPDVELDLSDVGRVRGVVRRQDGQPVSGAKVTLVAGSVQVFTLTTADGGFEFLGVPLSVALRLDADALVSGKAVFTGNIDVNGVVRDAEGQAVDVVALVLDVTPPTVVSVLPLPAATAVPNDAVVVVTFSEPIDPASVRACSPGVTSGPLSLRFLEATGTAVALNNPFNPCDDANVVPVAVQVSADATTVTLTPLQGLGSAKQYTVAVSRGEIDDVSGVLQGGIRDPSGLPLAADFVWSFVSRDNVSPRVLTVSPAPDATGITRDNVVRVTFSEPIVPASITPSSVVVNGPGGAVTGQRDLLLGNTVVVFTPTDGAGNRAFLDENASYTVTVAGVRDPAGNVQRGQDTVIANFQTRDTIPPTITAVTAPVAVRTDELFTATATTSDSDIAAVEFFVNGVLTVVRTTAGAPGLYQAELTMPVLAVEVAARAIDRAGNVGALSPAAAVNLRHDDPPTVVLSAPTPDTVASPGTVVRFVAQATDDVGIAAVRGTVSGVVTGVSTQVITPRRTPVTATFDIPIPATSADGTLTFTAVATDSKGQATASAPLVVTVRDDIDPTVVIEAPGSGTLVVAGADLTVRVAATDAAGVAEVVLEIAEIGFAQTQAVSPPAASVTRTFSVPVPERITPETVTLVARARDRSQRVSTVQRVLSLLKPFSLEATANRGQATGPSAASANVGQTIRLLRHGLTEAYQVQFVTTNAQGQTGTTTVPLFARATDGSAASAVVPVMASSGPVRLLSGQGTILPGEAMLQIVPTLEGFFVPSGLAVEPGAVAVLKGTGFRAGQTRIDFPGATLVAAQEISAANRQLTVIIPAGATPGELHIVTDGGMSTGWPLLGAFGLVGAAAEGVAIDALVAAANVGQPVTIVGSTVLTATHAVFSAIDATGTPTTVTALGRW